MFRVVESFTAAKSGDERLNEDLLAVTDYAAAVVDGVSGHPGTAPPTMGRMAALAVREAILGFGPKSRPAEMAAAMNEALTDIDGEAVAAVYHHPSRTVVRVGDIAVGIGGTFSLRPKLSDEVAAAARAVLLRTRLDGGADPAELAAQDPGREMIWPLLAETRRWGNRPESPLGFGVLNGERREPMMDALPVGRGAEVALASDGYPFPARSLRSSERALADYLAGDPLCLGPPPQTKGVEPGCQSFDDRAYLRLAT